ncbi:MAG: inositol monophosphatase [Candidatus Omnitrophica bacterium]|nr:inositol monophosphatase [Candidatus Omnitrophota bacterium]
MSEIMTVACSAAKEAGEFLKSNFGKISEIERKKDKSLVTNLDREAEKMIIDRIKEKFSDHGVIGEESGSQTKDSDYVWIIDPLDGTHNFIRNINIYGVSIGVAYKNELVAGVIYMPEEDELYSAQRGSGAYKNGKKISTSDTADLSECSISFDSGIKHLPKTMLRVLDHLSGVVFNIRMFGSSARLLSYVAEGKIDLAVEFHDRPWDFAGGVVIIEEAGGKTISLKGKPLTCENIGYIASNEHVFDAVKKIVFDNIR